MRLRVAVLGPAPPDRGGIARETRLLVEELSRRVEVSWWTFSRRYPRWLDPRRFDRDPELPASGARAVLDYRSPLSWRRTAEALASERPDALIVPWWTAFWGLPLRAVFRRFRRLSPSAPRVLLCHNVEDHEGGALRRFLAAGAFLASDAFVCHSREDARRLARVAPGRPARVLPHPIEVAAPGPGSPDPERARERLGIPAREPLVLFLGLVRRYKGLDVLLDAAPEIVRRTGARIAIVGEVFPDARDVLRRVESSPVRDRIRIEDRYVPEAEMDLWLAASHAVVLPYRAISGSGIAARAIAARRPMAASAIGGLIEAVVPSVTGELFAPGDAGGLAEATALILSRGIDSYAEGLARAAEAAAWPRYASEILDFVGELATAQGKERPVF